jgi:hypothetical protein
MIMKTANVHFFIFFMSIRESVVSKIISHITSIDAVLRDLG